MAPAHERARLQLEHADDVADAIARVLERRATGAFDLASEPVVDRDRFRRAFRAFLPPAPFAPRAPSPP